MIRRDFIMNGSLTLAGFGYLLTGHVFASDELLKEKLTSGYEVSLTEDEWRKLLTEEEFAVLREEATERPSSSPLNKEKRAGIYHCAGCDLPVYESKTKFDSGTGWPSFYDNIPDAVRTKEDNSFFSTRTEVHCRRCEGHLGHIFDDGPQPTGKRHCLNGIALAFVPAAA